MGQALTHGRSPRTWAERYAYWVWGMLAQEEDSAESGPEIAKQMIASGPGLDRSRPIPAHLNSKGQALTALGPYDEGQETLQAV